LYYLYIDESGTDDDYLDEYYNVIKNRGRFFTLGGIIANEDTRQILNKHHSSIITRFFQGITLPGNFKLHYHDLRTRKHPFDKLDDKDRYLIADQMFNGIKHSDSYLLLGLYLKTIKEQKEQVKTKRKGIRIYRL
jgi:hypothetical protein